MAKFDFANVFRGQRVGIGGFQQGGTRVRHLVPATPDLADFMPAVSVFDKNVDFYLFFFSFF